MASTVIKSIEPDSPLYNKVHPGDRLLAINGNRIADVLDYKYYSYDSKLTLEIEDAGGKTVRVRVRKEEGQDLGLEFETYLMDRARSCANKCLFCFIDQLPKGMRESLYFKDDDARLSFLTGNYITLTNLSERELDRIIALRISPINISVHATDPELRVRLLGNPRAAWGYEIMKRLAEGGITINCQIVCCPGLNDGQALSRTMEDLAVLYPQVASVSVVPVGLTKHREGLPLLRPFGRETAAETIRQVNGFGRICLEKYGSRIFYCADELYLKAGMPIPGDEYYEGWPQLENGVGMLRLLETEFLGELKLADPGYGSGRPFSIATGVAAAPFIHKLLMTAAEKCYKLQGKVYAVVNDFFGHSIDVAGLVTGGDLIAQLRGADLGERLLIPQNMLRHGEGVFLDDVTLEDVERELGIPVCPVAQDGAQLLRAMLE
ncbi:MAG: DUF512 domain-containing protein [Oscillospiraceae bacterium]|jgi:putative radical SAM enzyme (TIGR03279 family)